jgi:hypothetical protein
MADQELVIKISAKNLTADEFAKARKEVAGLNDETDKAKNKAKDAGLSWGEFGSSLSDVGGTMLKAGGIVAGAIGGIVAGVVELGKRGAEINDVRENFDLLMSHMGIDGKAAIATLSTSVDGMVSKFDLMKITNQGVSQGLKLTNEDFKTIGEGARVLAERVGGNTTEAYNTLIQAMASGRTMHLKEIGLNIDETQALKDHARALGVDATEMNEHGQKIAKTGAVLAELTKILNEGGRATMDFGDTFEQAKTKFADWMDDLGSGIAQSKVLGAALNGVGEIVAAVFGGQTEDPIKTIIGLIEQGAIILIEWGRTAVTAGDMVARVFSGTQVVFDAVGAAVAHLGEYFLKLVQGLGVVGSYIPGIGDQFEKSGQQAGEMSEYLGGVAKGFEEAGGAALQSAVGTRDSNDMFVRLDKALGDVRDKMVDAQAATEGHTAAARKNTAALGENGSQILSQNKLLDAYNKSVRDTSQNLAEAAKYNAPIEFVRKQFGQAVSDIVENASILGQKVPKIISDAFMKITLKGVNEQMSKELEQIIKDTDEMLRKHQDARNEAISANLKTIVDSEREASNARAKLSLNDYEYQKMIIEQESQLKKDALKKDTFGYADAMQAIDDVTKEKLGEAATEWKTKLTEMEAATNSLENVFARSMAEIPNLITGALSGSAGFADAAKKLGASMGSQIGSGMFEMGGIFNGVANKLTGGAMNLFGDKIGGALGMALPGIGGALGSLVGPLIDKIINIGGPSKAELDGRKVEATFEKSFGTFNDMAKAVGDAYAATGRSAQDANRDVLAMMAAEKQGADQTTAAVSKINQAFADQKQDAADLQAAIQEYGFTIEQLGPAMKKQQLTEEAVKLENQYRLLVGSGIDNNLVIEKMSANLNEYIQTSIRAGEAVPAEMKPIIEKMIEMGTLTDENGNKVDSLAGSGITFSETMTQGFDRVVSALNKVISTLGGVPDALDKGVHSANNLAGAINAIPSDKHVKVTTDFERNGDSSGDGVPAFATEAFVRKPTLAMIGDTPGGELVLKPQTIKNWINAAAGTATATAAQSAEVSSPVVDLDPLRDELRGMRSDMRNLNGSLARAVRDGILGAR